MFPMVPSFAFRAFSTIAAAASSSFLSASSAALASRKALASSFAYWVLAAFEAAQQQKLMVYLLLLTDLLLVCIYLATFLVNFISRYTPKSRLACFQPIRKKETEKHEKNVMKKAPPYQL